MKYPVIIFDWDGTLMDSIDKIVACVMQASINCGVVAPEAIAIKNIIGLSLDNAMLVLFPSLTSIQQADIINAYRKCYLSSNHQQTPFYPGIKACLIALKEKGYQLAVATGKGRNGLNKMLQQEQVEDLFCVTYCAEETASKPDPLMLHKILKDVNIEASKALMIGDSSYDLEMANNAGIDCIGVTYGVHDENVLRTFNPIALLDNLAEQLEEYI